MIAATETMTPASPAHQAPAPVAAGHTPGPWSACQGGTCTCGLIWDATGEVHVATAISGRDIGQPWHASDIKISDAEQRANARLIAAAPDLLAALQGMVALFEPEGDIRVLNPAEVEALTAARRALEAARADAGRGGTGVA